MIEEGADVNLVDNEGSSALHEMTKLIWYSKVTGEFFKQIAIVYRLEETGKKWIDIMVDHIPVVHSILDYRPEPYSEQPKVRILEGFDNIKINNDNFKLFSI